MKTIWLILCSCLAAGMLSERKFDIVAGKVRKAVEYKGLAVAVQL
ncbi:MAG TPA: hypothetical protein VHD83_26685 [Puia sp.]|nr:hypothetical protein [Puia sp.]